MIINIEQIYNYVAQFRKAIDDAKLNEKSLSRDIAFRSFPWGCCGDTCYLLAEYLRMRGIETVYVGGEEGDQTHAWLVVKDDRILQPTMYVTELPEDIKGVWSCYSGKQCESTIINDNYTEKDIEEGLIIDITADQFGQSPVHVGYLKDFHERFDFIQAHDCDNLYSYRLRELFQTIMKYI